MVYTSGLTQPDVAVIHAFVDRDVDASLCPGHLLPMLAAAAVLTDREASARTDHEAKAQHDAGYLRASQVIKNASEADRAADDIEANVNKAAKAHASGPR